MGTPQIPSVDSDSGQLPAKVRAAIGANLASANTPEAAGLAAGVASAANTTLPPLPAAVDPYGGLETVSPDYAVAVNGVPVFVHVARVQDAPFDVATVGYDNGGNYSFVNFDAPVGATTQVEIRSTSIDLNRAEFLTRRNSSITNVRRQLRRIQFTLTGPAKIAITHNGVRTPLMMFANPVEAAINANDPNVIYYGPGYYQPSGIIRVSSGKTLYVHRDAVIRGTISVDGDNATVRGRGIISGDHMPWGQGAPNTLSLLDIHGNNTTVEGVTLRGGPTWSLPSWHVTGTVVTNVKVCNGRVQNDDGIAFINSTGGRVSDCFVRSDDDCLTVKGTTASEAASDNQWTDMTLWSDRGRALLIGHESKASGMDNNKLSQTYILHTADQFYAIILQPGDELLAQGNVFDNITLRGESQFLFIQVQTAPTGTTSTTGGNVNGVTISNISVVGGGGVYAIDLRGINSTHTVQNVALSNVVINGTKVTSSGAVLRVGANVSGTTVS